MCSDPQRQDTWSGHRSDGSGNLRDARGHFERWLGPCIRFSTILTGVLALLWLVSRSGTRPSRLSYPCQQAALSTAALAFGVPFVAAVVSMRGRLGVLLQTGYGKMAAGGLAALSMVMLAVASVGDQCPVVPMLEPPPDYQPDVYLVSDVRGVEPGRHGGVDDLVALMGAYGLKLHRSDTTGDTSGPDGLIDPDDVVLIKVNGQWDERGGTNTDVLRGVIRRVVEHPSGFVGEIVVGENTQGYRTTFDLTDSNAEDHSQSVQDVVDDFYGEGWDVSTIRWDAIRFASVNEYSDDDMDNGYVVGPADPETLITPSYPKFRSAAGTYISYMHGVWTPTTQTYDPDRLVVINMPVFKTHWYYGITAAVKNHMGVVSMGVAQNSHGNVACGGMGTLLAEIRMPDLNILDCIWILARCGTGEVGPSAPYEAATRREQLVAGTDPVALDVWATKYIMMPQIIENGYTYADYHTRQDPDNPASRFRNYIDRSMNELLAAGIDSTNDYDAVALRSPGHSNGDAVLDLEDFEGLHPCLTGPGAEPIGPDCQFADFDFDHQVDLSDFGRFQRSFGGP